MSVSYRTSNYSDYLTGVCSLIGVDQSTFVTGSTELTFLNSFFNRALRKAWESNVWIDLCPYGEVRFPTNALTYPNDLSQSAYWTLSNGWASATANAVANPLDYRTTATKLTENTSSQLHTVTQLYTFYPNQPYTFSGYFQPNGNRPYFIAIVNDGPSTYTASFGVSGATGTVVSVAGSSATASIQYLVNNWYKWSLNFTSNVSAGTTNGAVQISPSNDGVSVVYTGSGYTCATWGNTLYLQKNVLPASYIIPFSQTGETAIDSSAVFGVWANDPGGQQLQYNVNYNLKPEGIEIVGPSNIGPLYLWYRPQRPLFTGSAWSSSTVYSTGQTMQFTSTAALTSGNTNYYTALATANYGQSPDTNPTLWSITNFPYIFEEYVKWNAYGDWLGTEGQAAKAQAAYGIAEDYLMTEHDKQERQAGQIMPWRVNTHVTSQNRGLGWIGQNSNALGSSTNGP